MSFGVERLPIVGKLFVKNRGEKPQVPELPTVSQSLPHESTIRFYAAEKNKSPEQIREELDEQFSDKPEEERKELIASILQRIEERKRILKT